MKTMSLVKGSGLVAPWKQVGAHSTGRALAAPVRWLQCGPFLEETEVNMDQRDASVLRVVRGKSGVWEVQAAGFDAPLFCFRSRQKAKDYAEDIALAKPGIVVEVYGEDGRLQSAVCAPG